MVVPVALASSGEDYYAHMLVENESATAQSIELMLRSSTINIFTIDLGEEGIDLGKIYDCDIILLDLNAPDTDRAM
jgi:two-component system cell cycle response regulator CtrA